MNTPAPVLAVLAAFGLTGSFLHAQTTAAAPLAADIMVSGFEAFGGHSKNASWVLAQEIAKTFPQGVRSLQVPVVWGAPLTSIQGVKPLPQVWIALGEGTSEFQIETIAYNQRGRYPDNHGTKPGTPDIISGAEAELKEPAEVAGLATALTEAGFPTHVSQNAGRYLCEEMFYALLHEQKQHPEALRLVLFIHVPPLGQSVPPSADKKSKKPQKKVDAALLQAFGRQLFTSLHQLGMLSTVPAATSAR